ncbi:MAG: leucine-rich repeat protein [Ruminococcus sp.]|nr:leucine-rich repeat protein [Ruminococcus sp.]
MKNFKRSFAALAAAAIALAALPQVSILEADAAQAVVIDNYNCTVINTREDGTVELKITGVVDDTITELVFPTESDGVPIEFVSIGDKAFRYCYELVTAILPDTIQSLEGDNNFNACTSLTEVSLPEGIPTIPSHAFYGCTQLAEINIPDSVTCIGALAFAETAIYKNQGDGIRYIDNWAIGLENEGETIAVAEGTVGLATCFAESSDITSCTLPSTLKYINGSAFRNLRLISEITLPDGLISIGEVAFYNTGLTSITIPGSVETIGKEAFWRASALETLVVESGVKNIGEGAFSECPALTSVTLEDGLESIGVSAFRDCEKLTTIHIPEGVTEIPAKAFAYCPLLKNVTIADSVTYIDGDAFTDSGVMNNTLAQLKYADKWLLGYNSNNSADTEVTVKEGTVGLASYSLRNMQKLTTLTLPEGLKYIGDNALADCHSLQELILPETVERIGNNAFYDCDLTGNLTFPASVNYIGAYATYFNNLDAVTILNPECEIYSSPTTLSGTIYGYTGSTAQVYAETYEREFIPLDGKTTGDADGDNSIGLNDASMVLESYAKNAAGDTSFVFNEDETENAAIIQAVDIDGDGALTLKDVSMILSFYAQSAAGQNPVWEDIIAG